MDGKLTAYMVGLGVVGALVAGHFLQVGMLKNEVQAVSNQRDRALESVRVLKAANDDLALTIAKQNQAVDALHAAATAREAAVKAASAEALKTAQRQYAAALAKLKQPMPVPGDACKSAAVILREAIAARRP